MFNVLSRMLRTGILTEPLPGSRRVIAGRGSVAE